MSFKVYNFRYRRGTIRNSVREVLVDSANDGKYLIEGYDRLADSREGGVRRFDRDQMTEVTAYNVEVVECKDEDSAKRLEAAGRGYERYGKSVVISKKMVLRKPEASVFLCGKAERGYVKISYGTVYVDLPLSDGKGDGFVFSASGEPQSNFENVITRLYNEIQKNK